MMNKKIAYIFLVIGPCILLFPAILAEKAMFWGLPELQFYPWRALAFDQILHGYMPLWNPYNGFGSPLLANYQIALFYPATWLLFIFYWIGNLEGMVWGHMLMNVGHMILAGIGMFKVANHHGISITGATLAGISLSLGGYLVARFGFFSMVWTAAWFPWIFLYTMKAYQLNLKPVLIKLLFSVVMMLLAGHAQLSWYILLFCFIWLVFQITSPLKMWFKRVLNIIYTWMFAVLICAIQLFPTAEFLFQSQRSSAVDLETALTYSFWPWHFLNFINPSVFGNPGLGNYWGYGAYWEDSVYFGLLPFLLVIASAVIFLRNNIQQKCNRREQVFFGSMILIGSLFALGKNLPLFPWLVQHVPTFDMFNAPSRFMIWVVFSASLLTGFTFDQWKKPVGKVLYWTRLGTAGGFGVGIGAGLMMLTKPTLEPTFIVAAFQLSILIFLSGILYLLNPFTDVEPIQNIRVKTWQGFVIFFVLSDLMLLSMHSIPVDDLSRIRELSRNHSSSERIYWREADDYQYRYNTVLDFSNYNNTLEASSLGKSQLANVNLFNHTSSLNNFEPMRLASYDNFMHALNFMPQTQQLAILAGMGVGTYIHLNSKEKTSIDRIDLASSEPVQFYSTAAHAESVNDFVEQYSLQPGLYIMPQKHPQEISLDVVTPEIQNSVAIEALIWEANVIQFDVKIPHEGWLLITDANAAGWRASVDEKSTPIYSANGFVKAIQISAGSHVVRFVYWPDSFTVGMVISLVSLMSLGILYSKNKLDNLELP
jgi:hypothetical protein